MKPILTLIKLEGFTTCSAQMKADKKMDKRNNRFCSYDSQISKYKETGKHFRFKKCTADFNGYLYQSP
jgi:hypothetical protein